jgi:hypothetical protein
VADRERFSVDFEVLPSGVPAPARLKALLKRALRDWKFRCLAVRDAPELPAIPERKEHKKP